VKEPKRKKVLATWATVVKKNPSEYEKEVLRAPSADNPESVFRLIQDRINREVGEVFYVVSLNGQHKITGLTEVARGGRHGVAVEISELFRVAVAYGAFQIILIHNHPSGDPTPSTEDREVTRKAVAAGLVLGITVVDHIVVAGSRYTSFAAQDLMS
jgi:DNA repair protein RadC